MKHIIYTLLLMFPIFCFGQKDEEIQAFINDALKELGYSSHGSFDLLNSSYKIDFDKYSFDIRDTTIGNFLKDNPDFSVKEFMQKAEKSKIINWKDYQIANAIILDSIPKEQEHGYVTFPTPIFSDDHQYAIFEYSAHRYKAGESWILKK